MHKQTITNLPIELQFHIVHFLSPHDVQAAALANKNWFDWFLGDEIWLRHLQNFQRFVDHQYGILWPSPAALYVDDLLPLYQIYINLKRLEKKRRSQFFIRSFYPETPAHVACWYKRIPSSSVWYDGDIIMLQDILCRAMYLGNLALVRNLLNHTDDIANELLIHAARSGNFALCEFLIKDKKLQTNEIVIKKAMRSGNYALVKWLYKQYEDKLTYTMPHAVFRSGNLKLVKYIIKKSGYPPNESDLNAAIKSSNDQLIDWLLKKKRVKPNRNTLAYAAKTANLRLVRYLLHKAKISPKYDLIFNAARSGSLRLVQWLIETEELRTNASTLSAAANSGNVKLVAWLINHQNLIPNEYTLRCATRSGNWLLIQWLLENTNLEVNPLVIKLAFDTGNLRLIGACWRKSNKRDLFANLDNMTTDLSLQLRRSISTDRLKAGKVMLDYAVRTGNLALVKWFIDNIEVEKIELYHGRLNSVIASGNLALLQWLLDYSEIKIDIYCLNYTALSESVGITYWLVSKKGIVPDEAVIRSTAKAYDYAYGNDTNDKICRECNIILHRWLSSHLYKKPSRQTLKILRSLFHRKHTRKDKKSTVATQQQKLTEGNGPKL